MLVVNLWAELGISPKHAASRKAKILRKPLKNKKTTGNLSYRWSFLTCRNGQISMKKVIYSRVRQIQDFFRTLPALGMTAACAGHAAFYHPHVELAAGWAGLAAGGVQIDDSGFGV